MKYVLLISKYFPRCTTMYEGSYCEDEKPSGSETDDADGLSDNLGLAIGLGVTGGALALALIIAIIVYVCMRNRQQYPQNYQPYKGGRCGYIYNSPSYVCNL